MIRKRHAKIVATLGPSSSDPAVIEQLYLEGVDVFRMNFSHGTHEDHQKNYEVIRKLEKKHASPIGILMDLQGPKLRVGMFEDGSIELNHGQKFSFVLDQITGDSSRVHLPHPEIFEAAQVGASLLLDDGKLKVTITSIQKILIETVVDVGGVLSNKKGVNVPDLKLPISALTKKDIEDLRFGLELGVDFVALSFVQSPEDVRFAHTLIQGKAKIISKLEKPLAIDHLNEIIELSDGVMVARGDLGVEMPIQNVPSIQKKIIHSCRAAGKPVIVATQMLESMITTPTPTRAEASDVATAVYDGADAVMLSAESASGRYPIEAVQMMNKIIQVTEADPYAKVMWDAHHADAQIVELDSVVKAVREIANISKSAGIVTFSLSGRTILRVVRERPYAPVFGLTVHQLTARFMTLLWGVTPKIVEEIKDIEHMVQIAQKSVQGILKQGDKIVITAGIPFGESGVPNILRIADVI